MASRGTAVRLYRLARNSTRLTDLPAEWQVGVDSALKQIETEDPRFVEAEIKSRCKQTA
ncbi:hypothetical protein FRC18_003645 [Serendipita sp. 400]|nr:hypothetical protein FRC18_003645 [Serendipita sp. 400]